MKNPAISGGVSDICEKEIGEWRPLKMNVERKGNIGERPPDCKLGGSPRTL